MKKDSTFKDAIKEVATPIEERRFTNIHNRIKNIKRLKRKESDFIASIDPDISEMWLKHSSQCLKK